MIAKSELIEILSCSACKEILFEPVTLPCGNSICTRCLRLPKQSDDEFALQAYQCPVKSCTRKHQYRKEKMNFLLHSLLSQLFPSQQKALNLCKVGEELLSPYWDPSDCVNRTEMGNLDERRVQVQQLIDDYFTPAISTAKCLQLPYILRSKAYIEMSLFEEANRDTLLAQRSNTLNKRGKAMQNVVQWRKEMFESKDGLKEAESKKRKAEEPTVAEAILALTSDLRKEDEESDCSRFEAPELLFKSMQSVKETDLECHICLGTMNSPITCPCGHTWCRSCIFESLSQSGECPLCRCKLPSPGYFSKRPVDLSVNAIIEYFGPKDVGPKTDIDLMAPRKIPLFVCSLVLPNATEEYHMFEPRYRVMIKKCLDSDREFGVVLPSSTGEPCSDFGTTVKIVHVEPLTNADLVETSIGDLPRYILEVKGKHRFKVLSTEVHEDGYFEGLVQRIEDVEQEDANLEWDPKALELLCSEARGFVGTILRAAPPETRVFFNRQHGIMPENPGDLSFWLAEFIPSNPHLTYTLLPLTSTLARMELLVGWIRSACSACA